MTALQNKRVKFACDKYVIFASVKSSISICIFSILHQRVLRLLTQQHEFLVWFFILVLVFQVICTYGYINKISDIFFTSLMRFAVYYWCYLLVQTRLLVFHADIFPVLLYCRLFANTQAESYMHMDLVCSNIFSSTCTTAFKNIVYL